MINTQSLIKAIGDQPLPPVEQWDPDYCGQLNLQIKADGTWWYQDSLITRRRLQILFSRVIKLEKDEYYLVTPHEKLSIQVDWMPFTIVNFEIISKNDVVIYQFFDNCDNVFELNQLDQLRFDTYQDQPLPIIQVRRNLFASFNRQCYYQLIESAQSTQLNKEVNQLHIQSNQIKFVIGEYPNS